MSAASPGPHVDYGAIVSGLRLAVFVLHRSRIVYQNDAAIRLRDRLQKDYQVDLVVMLRDHVLRIGEFDPAATPTSAVTVLTDPRGEPLYVHVLPIASDGKDSAIAISVRELG